MSAKQDNSNDDESQDSLSSSDSHLCCCICHCAVDYSDREAFFGNANERSNANDHDYDNSNNKIENQPLLLFPPSLYDEQNAMVLCDTCDRPYHQRCHFVPLITLPRGDWHCLICKSLGACGVDSGVAMKQVYPFPPKSSSTESGEMIAVVLASHDANHAWDMPHGISRHSSGNVNLVNSRACCPINCSTFGWQQTHLEPTHPPNMLNNMYLYHLKYYFRQS